MRIRRDSDGAEFEGPDGPVPAGYSPVTLGPATGPAGSVFSSPQGFFGPGLAANVLSRISGSSPTQAHQQIQSGLGYALPAAASLALPGPGSLLGRMALQGGIGGGSAALTGQGGENIAIQTALGAAFQGGAEALATPARIAFNAALARTRLANDAAKRAFDTAMTGTLNLLEKAGWKREVAQIDEAYKATKAGGLAAWETQKTAQTGQYNQAMAQQGQQHAEALARHGQAVAAQEATQAARIGEQAEGAATSIMDFFKSRAPALESLPSTVAGLKDAVAGRGRDLASGAFDKSMREVVEEGAGQMVRVSPQVVKDLRLTTPTTPGSKTGKEVNPFTAGAETIFVDAGELAKKAVGSWRKFRESYDEAFDALDAIGLGNEAERAAYRAYMGLREFVDRSGAIKGRISGGVAERVGELDVDRLWRGLHDVGMGDLLRRRGLGNLTEGPIAGAVTGGRLAAPPEIPVPVKPQPIPKPTPIPKPAPPPEPVLPEAPIPRSALEAPSTALMGRTVESPTELMSPGQRHLLGFGIAEPISLALGALGGHAPIGGLGGFGGAWLLGQNLPPLLKHAPYTPAMREVLERLPSMGASGLSGVAGETLRPPHLGAMPTPMTMTNTAPGPTPLGPTTPSVLEALAQQAAMRQQMQEEQDRYGDGDPY